MTTLKRVAVLEGHEHPIYALAISQKKHILFSGGGEGAVVEWSLKNMAPIKVMYKTRASIYCIHCPESLPLLISGDRAGQLSIFHFEKQELIYQQKLTDQAIFGMLSVDEMLYFISEDGYLRTFDLSKNELVSEHLISANGLRCLSYNPQQKHLYIGSKDLSIYTFSTESNRIIQAKEAHELPVFSIRYDEKNKRLISGSRDAQLRVDDFEEVKKIPAHYYAINDIQLVPSSGYIITASMDKTIKVWDDTTYDLLAISDSNKNEGHSKSVNRLAYTPFENYLISCSDDRLIMVWKIE